jgi:hypothetical protein
MDFYFEEEADIENTIIKPQNRKIETGCWCIDFIPQFEILEKLIFAPVKLALPLKVELPVTARFANVPKVLIYG